MGATIWRRIPTGDAAAPGNAMSIQASTNATRKMKKNVRRTHRLRPAFLASVFCFATRRSSKTCCGVLLGPAGPTLAGGGMVAGRGRAVSIVLTCHCQAD